jgi:hypothetical protein
VHPPATPANWNLNSSSSIQLQLQQFPQVTVLPFLLEICRLFGAFFLSPADLPSYFVWLDALSVSGAACYTALLTSTSTVTIVAPGAVRHRWYIAERLRQLRGRRLTHHATRG